MPEKDDSFLVTVCSLRGLQDGVPYCMEVGKEQGDCVNSSYLYDCDAVIYRAIPAADYAKTQAALAAAESLLIASKPDEYETGYPEAPGAMIFDWVTLNDARDNLEEALALIRDAQGAEDAR